MTYATQTEVLERMGQSASPTTELLSRVDDALLAATAQIETDTGRVFAQSTGARTLQAPSCWTSVIDVPDLRSVSLLEVDDGNDGTFSTTILSSDYELDRWIDRDGWAFDRLRLVNRQWPVASTRRRRIRITADWGWEAVPAQINQACSLLAARLAQRTTSAVFGTQSFGDIGTAPIRTSDPDYRALIGSFTRMGVA